MAFSGETCSICRTVLLPDTESVLKGRSKPPHQSFEIFRAAALGDCVICSTIWNLTDQHRHAWSDASQKSWTPMQYTTRLHTGGEKIVNVLFTDPIAHQVAHARFTLIPMDSAEYSPYFMSPNLESSTGSAHTLASFNPNQLPTRLIDAGNDGDTDWFLRVVREDGVSSPSAPYMTLSYRWGDPTISLLSSNITRFRRGSPIADPPSTFQDFIAIARRFGIQYVWIDALCIVQDSTEDWEAEASTMSHVYANSACNIAASASNNPKEGLFRPREPDLIRPGKVLTSLFADKPSPHYIFDKGYWDRQLFSGPLHNRGWVFQECFLAPRALYFGKDQVLWECLCEHKCEGFPQCIPAHYSDKNMDPLLDSISAGRSKLLGKSSPLVFYLWNSLVEQYSTCHLTEPSDKMVAITGIARLFGQITGDEYVAGWWKSWLLESLDWTVTKPQVRLSEEYRAPSWSWASLDGPVRLTGPCDSTEFLVQVIDVQVTTRGPGEMADIIQGHLVIRGRTVPAVYLESGAHLLVTSERQLTVDLFLDSLSIDFPEGKMIECIPLKKDYLLPEPCEEARPYIQCLLLEEVGPALGIDSRYRRVGSCTCYAIEDVEYLCTAGETLTRIIV